MGQLFKKAVGKGAKVSTYFEASLGTQVQNYCAETPLKLPFPTLFILFIFFVFLLAKKCELWSISTGLGFL